MVEDKERALQDLNKILNEIQNKLSNEAIGLLIKDSKGVKIGSYVSKGYNNATQITHSEDIEIGVIDSTASEDLQRIEPIIEEIIISIQKTDKPKNRLVELWQKLAPLASWASLVYNVLHNSGYL